MVRRGVIRTALSHLIVIAGVLWVLYVFWRELPFLRENFRIDSWGWLGFTLVAGTVAQLLLVPIFRLILGNVGAVSISYSYAARLLFVAQVLRHLPGRLWGIVYLVKETRQSIPPVAMIRANLDVMFYSLVFSLLVAGFLLLAVKVDLVIAAAAVVVCVGAIGVSIRYDWTGSVLRQGIRWFPAKTDKYVEALRLRESLSWSSTWTIVVFFILAWCAYLSVWWALPRIFPSLADVNIWLLCASYSAAWVIGYVAMITPGGLGVREAGFIVMSTKVAALPVLTFLAVFVRLWQILIELALFLMFAFVKPNSEFRRTVTNNE